MKKATVIVIALSLVLAVAIAFATTDVTGPNYVFLDPSSGNTDLTFSASHLVKVYALAGGNAYAAVSKHRDGNRTFGATASAVNLFWTGATAAGTDISGSDPSASDSSAFSSWSTL